MSRPVQTILADAPSYDGLVHWVAPGKNFFRHRGSAIHHQAKTACGRSVTGYVSHSGRPIGAIDCPECQPLVAAAYLREEPQQP